jgi:hypothetical protein
VVLWGGGSWGEDMRGSAFSGCRKKVEKKNLTFLSCYFRVWWVPFLTVVTSITLLGAARVVRLARECP